jgi:hypothetical protein
LHFHCVFVALVCYAGREACTFERLITLFQKKGAKTMIKTTIFRIVSILIMVFMTLAAAAPAYADTHVLDTYEIDDYVTFIVGDPDYPSPCDFDILVHGYGVMRYNYWVDEDNQATYGIDIYGNYKETWSAHGKTVNAQTQGPIKYDIEYYSDKIILTRNTMGANLIVTVPGYGKIIGGGGLILETLTFTPDWSTLIDYRLDKYVGNFNWEMGPVCAFLGP